MTKDYPCPDLLQEKSPLHFNYLIGAYKKLTKFFCWWNNQRFRLHPPGRAPAKKDSVSRITRPYAWNLESEKFVYGIALEICYMHVFGCLGTIESRYGVWVIFYGIPSRLKSEYTFSCTVTVREAVIFCCTNTVFDYPVKKKARYSSYQLTAHCTCLHRRWSDDIERNR